MDLPSTDDFSSRHGEVGVAASNWRNLVVWLPAPLALRAGRRVRVETTVDAREAAGARYSLRVEAEGRTVTLELPSLYPWFKKAAWDGAAAKMAAGEMVVGAPGGKRPRGGSTPSPRPPRTRAAVAGASGGSGGRG